jgi:hypothetical protein
LGYTSKPNTACNFSRCPPHSRDGARKPSAISYYANDSKMDRYNQKDSYLVQQEPSLSDVQEIASKKLHHLTFGEGPTPVALFYGKIT